MATDRIEVAYEIVTPMFCGGASPKDKAELRLPSFKGVLRWWWRALAWSRLKGNLSAIQEKEDALFGSARRGQGKIAMRLLASPQGANLLPPNVLRQTADANSDVVGEGARYLGYGVMEAFARREKDKRPAVEAGQLIRACLQTPFDFKIELSARDLDETERSSLLNALKAVGVFGGIGAKTRKGYGSVVLRSMSINGESCWSAPTSMSELEKATRQLLAHSRTNVATQRGLPPYTALSQRTRVVIIPAVGQVHPLALLDRVGREMMRYRSWGHNGKVLGSESEKNFREDHDLMKQSAWQRRTHPKRIVFGLPHNYGNPDNQQVGPADNQFDRRASPLFIHIHECGTTPIAVLSLLPAQFLPGDNPQVNVGGRNVALAADEALWKPVGDFLDRLLNSEKRQEPFGQAVEVRP